MGRGRAVLGYMGAALALPLVLAVFLGREPLSRALARTAGLRISPLFTGGAIATIRDHGSYRTIIHRPVFLGLLRESRRGFVQVDWEPTTGLPRIISEEVSGLGEGQARFWIRLDTRSGQAVLGPGAEAGQGLESVRPRDGGWTVRVWLLR